MQDYSLHWYKLLEGESLFDSYLSQLIIFSLGIPIYHFFLYPLFYNYIPTMLNRIRVGLVLIICSRCMFAFVGELLVCNSPANNTCLLFHSEMFSISSNGGWWIIGSTTVFNTGFLLSAITLFEFVCAQSPRPFCGILTGFFLMSSALSSFIGYGISELVAVIVSKPHSWFYSNLFIALLIFVYFVFFHCVSKRYKLRKRDDIVPIHLFAEEFFEKELRGQERLDEERSSWERRSNIAQ